MKLKNIGTLKDEATPVFPSEVDTSWDFPDKPIKKVINIKPLEKKPIQIKPIPKPVEAILIKANVKTLNNTVYTEEALKNSIKSQEVTVWDKQLVSTSRAEGLSYPFEFFNPPQSEFFVNRHLDANFIISAATSAGKTVIAELARNGKFLYLSPLKAISQEKRDDWSDPGHAWSKLNVSISTGDYMLTPDRVEEMRKADVIVMTSEMLDSRSRNMASERNDWLRDIKTLVIDEFHLIGYDGRGDKLESALIRFTEQNPDCRIVCLSATMPNVGDLSQWLSKLNGKLTVVILSNYRPVTLNRHYPTYIQSKDYREREYAKLLGALKIVKENREDKFIVFVHSKDSGRTLLNTFKQEGINAEFHNADLDKEERIRIQKEFNSKDKGSLRVLVATSTLAWGVNTPADSVVIVGIHRGINLVNNQDIHQMCGRAGRVGRTAKAIGNAYILVPNIETETVIKWCEKIQDIQSRMSIKLENGLETLCFHIISEVLNGYIKNEETLLKWYDRTLANFQGVPMTLEDAQAILAKLENIKMIKKDELGFYTATGLGRVSAYLYYSPFDIYDWYKNFSTMFASGLPDTDIVLSWALGKATGYDTGYIPKPAQIEAEYWVRRAENAGVNNGITPHVSAAYYHLLAGTEEYPGGLLQIKRQIQGDFDRITQALKMMDKMYGRWNKDNFWTSLGLRIKYGIKVHLLELVQLPEIGAKRAKNLFDNGIKTRKDFIEKPHQARGIVGSGLYDRIIQKINAK